MNHYLLTRAVYSPAAWPPEANRRRLDLFRGVTVASLAAQTTKDWTWLLAVHPEDPLLLDRLVYAREAGVPVRTLPVPTVPTHRPQAALLAYQAAWTTAMDLAAPRLMTRLDDDDAFTPDAFARLHSAVAHQPGRVRRLAWMFPVGVRVCGSRYAVVHHHSNAMHTLQVPAGDEWTVYTYRHRVVAEHVPVKEVDQRPAWLWLRHPDTLSGWKRAHRGLNATVQRLFPAVDWDLLATLPAGEPRRGGTTFR